MEGEASDLQQKVANHLRLLRLFTSSKLVPLLCLQLGYRYNNKTRHTCCRSVSLFLPNGIPAYSTDIEALEVLTTSADVDINNDYDSFSKSVLQSSDPVIVQMVSSLRSIGMTDEKITPLLSLVVAVKKIGYIYIYIYIIIIIIIIIVIIILFWYRQFVCKFCKGFCGVVVSESIPAGR